MTPQSSDEVKNVWSYPSTPQHVFMTLYLITTGRALPYLLINRTSVGEFHFGQYGALV